MAATVGNGRFSNAAMRSRPRLTSLRARFGIGFGAAEFLEIGAGDEHAGLAAHQNEAVEIAAALELRDGGFEIALHRLAERVGPAAGLVERQQGDVAFEEFPGERRIGS